MSLDTYRIYFVRILRDLTAYSIGFKISILSLGPSTLIG